jgi:hypothetical protein
MIRPNQKVGIFRKFGEGDMRKIHYLTTCECNYCKRDMLRLKYNIRHGGLFVDSYGIIHNQYTCTCKICKNVMATRAKIDELCGF